MSPGPQCLGPQCRDPNVWDLNVGDLNVVAPFGSLVRHSNSEHLMSDIQIVVQKMDSYLNSGNIIVGD